MRIVEWLRYRRAAKAIGIAAALGVTGGIAFAQTGAAGDPRTGHMIATRWCAECHQIAPDRTGPVQPDVPPFHQIANRPGISEEILTTFITLPHPPMPPLALTRQETADLASYILSLRD